MRLVQAITSGWNTGNSEREAALKIKTENDWNWGGGIIGGPVIPDFVATNSSMLHPVRSAMGEVRRVFNEELNRDTNYGSALETFSIRELWPTTKYCFAVAHLLGSDKKGV